MPLLSLFIGLVTVSCDHDRFPAAVLSDLADYVKVLEHFVPPTCEVGAKLLASPLVCLDLVPEALAGVRGLRRLRVAISHEPDRIFVLFAATLPAITTAAL